MRRVSWAWPAELASCQGLGSPAVRTVFRSAALSGSMRYQYFSPAIIMLPAGNAALFLRIWPKADSWSVASSRYCEVLSCSGNCRHWCRVKHPFSDRAARVTVSTVKVFLCMGFLNGECRKWQLDGMLSPEMFCKPGCGRKKKPVWQPANRYRSVVKVKGIRRIRGGDGRPSLR